MDATFEVTVPRGELIDAMKTAGFGIGSTVPILGFARLDAEDDLLTVSTFDYEVAVSVSIEAKVTTPGVVLVDHAELSKLAVALFKGTRKAEADAAPLTISATGAAVTVTGNGYTIPVESAPLDDYPSLPEIAEADATLDRAVLVAEADRVVACAGKDETLPMLNALRVAVSPGAVTLAATDRFRLAESVLGATDTSGREAAGLLPRSVVPVIKRLTGETVTVGLTDSAITILGEGMAVVARTVDAEFPPYAKLFPSPEVTVTIGRAALTQAAQRAKAVVDIKERAGWLRLNYHPWAVTVTPNVDGATAPELPAEVEAEGAVSFNAGYMVEALASFTSERLALAVTSPTKPLVITGEDEPGYRLLLMPVRQAS